MRAFSLCAVLATAVIAHSAAAQAIPDGLVVACNDPTMPTYISQWGGWQPLFSGMPIWAMAFDPGACTLYLGGDSNNLMRFSPGDSGPAPVGMFINTANGRRINFVSLAFSSGTLYGTRNITTDSGAEGLYTINPQTGDSTLVWAYPPELELSGLFPGPDASTLYALNDSSVGASGRGLYLLSPGGRWLSRVTAYPATLPGSAGGTDIDGLAVANGRAYLIPDEPGSVGVYNSGTGQFEGSFPNPWTHAAVFSSAAWAPCLLSPCAPCPADFNQSGGTPDDADVAAFLQAWNQGDRCGDVNRSGGTPDDSDIAFFFQQWAAGGC